MKSVVTLPSAPAATPELAQRFGAIIAGLVAVVARRFLREPRLVGLILPLCRWLARTVRRFARVTAGPAVVPASRAGRVRAVAARGTRLPSQRAWLLRELLHEAAVYRGYLEQLLAEPATQAALAEAPGLGRLLRPLCHMLGIDKTMATANPVAAVPTPELAADVEHTHTWRVEDPPVLSEALQICRLTEMNN